MKVKYKQAALGAAWAILQPLLLMLLFTLIFSKGLKLATGTLPYPFFAYAGLTLWHFFSSSVSHAAASMAANSNIIKKIYFPRLVVPLSAVAVAAFDFGFAFLVLLGLAAYFEVAVGWMRLLFFLPASLLLAAIAATGMGTLLAALNVKYKDFQYVIPFLLQVLFFASPVIYSAAILGEGRWMEMLDFNPVAGAIHLFRSAFSAEAVDWSLVGKSSASALLLFASGIFFFRKTEAFFADLA